MNKQTKELIETDNKRAYIHKLCLSLFSDALILYIENPKNSTKKLLELINDFCVFAGYNIIV